MTATYQLTHLEALEAEAIHILREVVAEFDNPVMLYSVGKDSSVMVRLAQKEKLVRVALMALKNLISVGPMSLEYAVVEKGLPKALSNRSLQARRPAASR